MEETPAQSNVARHHGLPPGSPCPNCATVLLGAWCHACGQSTHDFHRQAYHLVAEAFESIFHADGRLWRTLRRLLFEPGRLTRDYIDGHRAPQIPPLRLFLVSLFLLFLVGSWTTGTIDTTNDLSRLSPQDRAELEQAKAEFGLSQADGAQHSWLDLYVHRAAGHPAELLRAMANGARISPF